MYRPWEVMELLMEDRILMIPKIIGLWWWEEIDTFVFGRVLSLLK